MKYKFIDENIKYIGSQLAPHWIYKNFKIQGDAIVAFIGECEVKLTEMVDIEDVINDEPIYSKNMLSFISEQFGINLVEGVFRQRLLICVIKELLEERGIFVVRNGDDLMINGRKLSVSIATKSITSVLIHTGLNILSEDELDTFFSELYGNKIEGLDKIVDSIFCKYDNILAPPIIPTFSYNNNPIISFLV